MNAAPSFFLPQILESSQGLLEVLKRYNKPEEFSSGATRESPSVNDGSP
jgi:hypothetical protein